MSKPAATLIVTNFYKSVRKSFAKMWNRENTSSAFCWINPFPQMNRDLGVESGELVGAVNVGYLKAGTTFASVLQTPLANMRRRDPPVRGVSPTPIAGIRRPSSIGFIIRMTHPSRRSKSGVIDSFNSRHLAAGNGRHFCRSPCIHLRASNRRRSSGIQIALTCLPLGCSGETREKSRSHVLRQLKFFHGAKISTAICVSTRYLNEM